MNLASILIESAERLPDKTALLFGGRSYTYREFLDRVRILAGSLESLGIGRGDHVSLIADNSNAVLECVFACMWIGAVCEQYNTRLSPLVLGELLGSSPSRVALASSRCCGELESLDLRRPDGAAFPLFAIDDGKRPEVPGGAPRAGMAIGRTYSALMAGAPLEGDPVDLPPEAPCMEFFTSGTTGLPRGVLVSHGPMARRLAIDCTEMGFSQDDVVLCVLPLYHVTSMAAYVALMVGAELIISRATDGRSIARAVNAYGVTRMGIVPFLLRALVAAVQEERIALPTLALLIYGGEPIDRRLLQRCRESLDCDLIQGYGMTETLSAITLLRPLDHCSEDRLDTAGTAVSGMEVRIVDEGGRPLPVGECGEVAVRTPTLMLGYQDDPQHTAEVIRDGWYLTGDIGYLDGQGYLTLVDRKHNMIITGGENVYPSEVAKCLLAYDGVVRDAAVVGIPDDYWGEALAAFVVLQEGSTATPEELIEYCGRRLGMYKRPKRVVFVDSLRRNASGKVPAEYLRELTASL